MVKRNILGLVLATAVLSAGCQALPTIFDTVYDAAVMGAKDRTFYTIAEDYAIKMEIAHTFLDKNLLLNISTDVYQGKVMLTGSVNEPKTKMHAETVAWKPQGVREVVNEIQVANGYGPRAFATDLYIENMLFGELLVAKGVSSVDYLWRSVDGVVYLIGMAETQEEMDHVHAIVQDTPGVKKFVCHGYVRAPGDGRGSYVRR